MAATQKGPHTVIKNFQFEMLDKKPNQKKTFINKIIYNFLTH